MSELDTKVKEQEEREILDNNNLLSKLFSSINSVSKLINDYCKTIDISCSENYNNAKTLLKTFSELSNKSFTTQYEPSIKNFEIIQTGISKAINITNVVRENTKSMAGNLKHFGNQITEIFKLIKAYSKELKSQNFEKISNVNKNTFFSMETQNFKFISNADCDASKERELAKSVLNFIRVMDKLDDLKLTKLNDYSKKKTEFCALKVRLRKQCQKITTNEDTIQLNKNDVLNEENKIIHKRFKNDINILSDNIKGKLDKIINEHAKQINELKEQNQEPQNKRMSIFNEVNTIINYLKENSEEKTSLINLMKSYNKYPSTNEEINNIEGKNSLIMNSINDKPNITEDLKNEIEKLEQEIEVLKQEKRKIRRKLEENIEKKEAENKLLQNTILSNKYQIESLNEENNHIKQINISLKREIEVLLIQVKEKDMLLAQSLNQMVQEEQQKSSSNLCKSEKSTSISNSRQTFCFKSHKIVTNKRYKSLNWYLLQSLADNRISYKNFAWVQENEINLSDFNEFLTEGYINNINNKKMVGEFKKLEQKEEQIGILD